MKTIRWFLSHFFLFLLIAVVIYGYMFWGNLAGKDTPAGEAIAYLSNEFVEVDKFVKAVKARQAELSSESSPAETAQSLESVPGSAPEPVAESTPAPEASAAAEAQADSTPADMPESIAEKQPAAVVVAVEETVVQARNITQQPVSISYSHNQMRVKQNSVGQIESQPEPAAQDEADAAGIEPETQAEAVVQADAPAVVEAEPAIENETPAAVKAPLEVPSQVTVDTAQTADKFAADKFVSPKVEQLLNNVDKNGKVINPALKTYAIRDSWVTARKSFYQRKYALSEQSYREVINNTSDNFDAYGELGNVYFNQGKNTEAAAAYFEAASILVKKGQLSRARSLMGVLRHLDNSKAAELKKLIDSTAS